MNRKDRRTKGLDAVKRLEVLKRSVILQDIDLKDIPKDILYSLIANKCENKTLQRKYNTQKRLLGEVIELEAMLHNMRVDLNAKLNLKGKSRSRQQA
jgi:hypothetical protein